MGNAIRGIQPVSCCKFLIVLWISFFVFNGISAQDTPSLYSSQEAQIIALFDSVNASDKYIEKLDSGDFFNLPLGIMGGDNEDPAYAILIDEVVLYPDKATFSASMVLTNPMDSSRMVFKAKEVPFSFSGGIQGAFRLELISEKPVTLCEDAGLQILSGSYVEADCKGFKSLHVKGRFELSEKRYQPADENGNPKVGKVSSFFETTVQSWNDLTFSISLEPFQLKQYPDFTFQCRNLSVDFSDYKNPTTLKFPKGYNSPYPAELIQLWRGVYIEEAELILNKEKFKKRGSNDPIVIGVNNLIIDELGFTGKVYVESQILSLEQGSLAGWKFSIDKLSLDFMSNDLVGGSLEGLMHVPAFDEETNFEYSAFVDVEGNYGFTVSPDKELSFSLFGNSTLDIYETSFINITSDSNGFVPTANFNGKMTISGKSEGSEASASDNGASLAMTGVEFQGLKISTQEPLLDIEYMAYHGSGQSKLSKFPITISDIVFTSTASNAKMAITAAVNFKKDSDEGFGGKSTINLLADREDYKYKFKGVEVGEISIHVEKPGAYNIKGAIAFARGDSIYGNGFKGSLDATFGDNIEVTAEALFGNVDGYRYFFVDGMFGMKPGIQAGPITIFGFGGGLYHHMRQIPNAEGPQYNFGRTLSNLVYKPDDDMALGIRAGVKLGIGGEQIINADVKFEIAFTKHAGIAYISFDGLAKCITPPLPIDLEKVQTLANKVAAGDNNSSASSEAAGGSAIAARMSMFKDFENDEFHADMEMFINLGGVITGVGENNRAGWAVVHSSREEWYIHIGTPTDPIGIQLLGLAKFKSYFMAGHRIPSTMPIHPKVAEILKISTSDIENERDLSKLEGGKGLAFGASFEISTGDKSFLIFYGSFDLGLGFDILLRDYGPGAYCAGSSPPFGINGWYAKGQAYAYFSGEIGLEAKVFGKRKKFEILSIATAAYLRAELPNPAWMLGVVGGEYRILGGMIKGNCKFQVEVGEKCEIQGAQSALLDLQLISDVNPGDKEEDVDVFTTPQVIFNVPVEKEQKISEDDGTNTYFRIKLEELIMKDGETDVPFTMKWNSGKDVIQIIPGYVLYPEKDYDIEVKIAFEEKINGIWQAFEDNGEQLTETRTARFKTGELPDRIPSDEITYSYPIDRQYNFMPEEYNKGYFIFRRDLQAFFTQSDKYEKKIRWKASGSAPVNTDIFYNSGENTLDFDLPSSMKLDKIYHLELLAIPLVNSDASDRNVCSDYKDTSFVNDTSNTTVKLISRKAEGNITTVEEKTMFDIHFKTSTYEDFASRFNTEEITVRALYDAGYMMFYLITDMPGGEALDKFEKGWYNNNPLIKMEADLGSTDFFNEYVYAKNYEEYPYFGRDGISWRDTTRYGLNGRYAISVTQSHSDIMLTDQDIEARIPLSKPTFSDFVYMQGYVWDKDYMDIRNTLANYYLEQCYSDPTLAKIMKQIKLRSIPPGEYPITIRYNLPGKNIITSSKKIVLINTIKTDASDY